MRYLVIVLGLFMVAFGTAGVVAPNVLVAFGRYSVTTIGLYAVAAGRLGIGFLFLRVAPASLAPKTLRVLGVIALVAGLATALLGVDRARMILDWWVEQGPAFIRASAGGVAVLGGFIACVVALGGRPA